MSHSPRRDPNPSYATVPTPTGRTIVVGDIHGCYRELTELLERLEFSGRDLLVCVGDLVDRGPESWSVLRYFATMANACAVLGNHERRLARGIRGVGEPGWGQEETLRGFDGSEAELAEWAEWLEALPAVVENEHVLAVHGRLDPDRELNEQDPYYCAAVGGEGVEIPCDEAGVPQWYYAIESLPEVVGRPVCFGHLAYQRVQLVPGRLYALDTGVADGKELTAVVLPEGEVVRVESAARYTEQAYTRWLERKYLEPQTGELALRAIHALGKKRERHPVEEKALHRVEAYLRDMDVLGRLWRVRAGLEVRYGDYPEPGPERGRYIKHLRSRLSADGNLLDLSFRLSRFKSGLELLGSYNGSDRLGDLARDLDVLESALRE